MLFIGTMFNRYAQNFEVTVVESGNIFFCPGNVLDWDISSQTQGFSCADSVSQILLFNM